MQTLKAYVRKGRLLMDEPTEIPEGTEIELIVANDADDLEEEERKQLHRVLRKSWASARSGRTRPVQEIVVTRQL